MESITDLPFTAEYAKSSRSSCKGCKMTINKDELRLGIMVQSPHFDGKIPNWFHGKCFWKKSRVKTEGDIHGFDNLRWDDQEEIRNKVKECDSGISGALKNPELTDFAVEYAVSGRAKCKGCIEKIENKCLRISRMDYDSKGGRLAGGVPAWYHVDCFVAKRDELEFWEAAEKLPGFAKLSDEDQKSLKSKLKSVAKKRKAEPDSASADGPVDAKKAKNGDVEDAEKVALKEQSEFLWRIRDNLKRHVGKREMSELLECNGQEIPAGESKIMDRLSDCMAFGATLPCPECQNGQLVYSATEATYLCHGAISGFTKCQHRTLEPGRKDFRIPKDFKENEYLSKFKFKPGRKRLIPSNRPAPTSQTSIEPTPSKPLDHLRFVIHPKLAKANTPLVMAVKALGGNVIKNVDPTIIALIASEEDVVNKDKDKDKMLTKAREGNVHVVSPDFVGAAKGDTQVAELVKKHSIATWGGDVDQKISNARYAKSAIYKKQKEEERYKSMQTSKKLVIKGGGVVDADSNLDHLAHVYEDAAGGYTVVLGMVDVQSGSNSYYRLQILKHDSKEKYWIFRAWGRTGTTIGGTKLQDGLKKAEAIAEFKRLYFEKTGNEWEDRKNFVKYPNRHYPLEMDYGEDEPTVQSKVEAGSKSKLAKPIQDLLKLIFDIEQMKETMKEFEIDLKKMPLGKISKNQIKQAYTVLTELQKIMTEKGGDGSKTDILDASNRFYTLVPHDFGMQKPPLLDSEDIIKSKTDMLDNLLEIEIAYNMLKNVGADAEADPLDGYYSQLKTDFDVVERTSDEFGRIQEYVKNTHAATHGNYSLDVEELFKINRHGEAKRFKPFKKLPNHQLLWHGSRVSNFGGILSQGLRIAPPEAPSTGYMFGKGIYFADMVSKSANYCHTSKQNPTGLLMLCDVALGEMEERKHADFIATLPPGKHSCWGQGQTAPDPKAHFVDDDGVLVPMGKGVSQTPLVGNTSLLYNEFIVYDVAQVRMKYLIRMNFKYKW